MSKRTYCDGCDQEIVGVVYTAAVVLVSAHQTTVHDQRSDLCDGCSHHFRQYDPRKWPREVKKLAAPNER